MRIVTLKDVGAVTSDITDGVYLGVAITAWSGTSSYAVGDIIYYAATRPNYVYKCTAIVTHTTDTEPIPSLDTSRWAMMGTTDRDAEFDDLVNTQSQAMTTHTATVDSSGTNYVAFFALEAIEITLTLTSLGVVHKSETIDLRAPTATSGWWSYFFEDVGAKKQVVWEYPKYFASSLTVTISNWPGLLVKCGVFRWGIASGAFAPVQMGVTASLIDYSTKGTLYAVNQGPSADNLDLSIMLSASVVDNIKHLFKSQVGRVAVYDCNDLDTDQMDGFVLLAIYKSFTRVFDYRNFVKCNISLQGVA